LPHAAGDILIAILALTLLGEFPLYGVLVGYANYRDTLRKMIYWIAGVHLTFYMLASIVTYALGRY
jgi:hypothetical protein